jgi:hypothetical protein
MADMCAISSKLRTVEGGRVAFYCQAARTLTRFALATALGLAGLTTATPIIRLSRRPCWCEPGITATQASSPVIVPAITKNDTRTKGRGLGRAASAIHLSPTAKSSS